MRIAILSDIHGNIEAFEAVLEDLKRRTPDRVICLGDLVGYGPDPEEVVQLFIKNKFFSVIGNHEASLKEKKARNTLNFQAKENSIETEKLLSPDSLQYCIQLENNTVLENLLFVHGFPPSSPFRYLSMTSDDDLLKYFRSNDYRICFVGHTHDLLSIYWDGSTIQCSALSEGRYPIEHDMKYIVNAGSVGQPRDGNNSAKYLFIDTKKDVLDVIYIPYDFKKTARKIKERGFPEAYGLRLY